MRHSRGTDLSCYVSLGEIAEGDIHPHISAEVDHDGIDVREGQAQLSNRVMRLNLGGVAIPLNPEISDEFL